MFRGTKHTVLFSTKNKQAVWYFISKGRHSYFMSKHRKLDDIFSRVYITAGL